MSPIALLCVCLLQFVSVLCQADKSGVYAIGGMLGENGRFIESSLIKYDVITGNSTLVYKSDFNWTKNSKSCFDEKLNIWYFITQRYFDRPDHELFKLQTVLARYNLETDERLSDINIHEYFPWINFVDCVGNTNNGDIYLFGNNMYNNTMLLQLITSNADNQYAVQINNIKNYGEDIFNSTQLPFAGIQPIFDSKRNMVWFNGAIQEFPYMVYSKMYYIDITTGNIEKTVNFSVYGEFPFPRSAIYDAKLDAIIGLNFTDDQINGNFTWTLEYADAVNLDITDKLDAFKDYCPWYLHSPTIDIDNNIFYEFVAEPLLYPDKNACPVQIGSLFIPQFHLLGIDINSGKILTQPPIDGVENNGTIPFSPSDIIFWNGQ